MAKSYFTEEEVLKKYRDIVDANQKPGWRSRSDEELVKYQILMQYAPEVSCYLMNYRLIRHSHQIQWVPTYFWEKNISKLEQLVQNKNKDAAEIVEGLQTVINNEASRQYKGSSPELKQKFNELFNFIKSQSKSFFSERTSVSYENSNKLCCIEAPLPEIARAELYALEERRIFYEFDLPRFRDPKFFWFINRFENSTTLEKLATFNFYNEYLLNSLSQPFSIGYIIAVIRLDQNLNEARKLQDRLLVNILQRTRKRNPASIILIWLLMREESLSKVKKEIISEVLKKSSRGKIDMRFVMAYIFNPKSESLFKVGQKVVVFDEPDLSNPTDGTREFVVPFLLEQDAQQFIKLFSSWNVPLELFTPAQRKEVFAKITSYLEKLKTINGDVEYFVEKNLTKLNKFPTELIGQMLRLAISSKHTPILSQLIRTKKVDISNRRPILNQRQLNMAKTLIEEELRRGDESAMDELSKLILEEHHTKKMLNILIYHLGWNSDEAISVMYSVFRRAGKYETPQPLIDFLYSNVSPTGINPKGEKVEDSKLREKYELFVKLYPLLFTGNTRMAESFYNLSESSKWKIYYLFINNRKFRNGKDKKGKFFEGLSELYGTPLYNAVDTLIAKEGTSNTQIVKKLNKLIRKLNISKKSKNFRTKQNEIAQKLAEFEDIETALKQVDDIFAETAQTELSTLSKENIKRLIPQENLLEKVLHLNGAYHGGRNNKYHEVYMEGVARFLLGKHDGFRYKDLAYLLKKYGKTTNLTPKVTKKWIKTRREDRIPESIQAVDANSLLVRLEAIKCSVKNRTQNTKLNRVKELLEKLEPMLGKLKPRDVDGRKHIIIALKEIVSKLKESGEHDLAGTISAIIASIESKGSEKYVVTDEFEFNKAHDIGEVGGTCQRWHLSNGHNKGLVATINDGTKKYVIVKDPTRNGRWLARGNINLALRENEFVLVLTNNNYSNLKEQRTIIKEFAQNKANEMGIPFVDAKVDKSPIKFFGKPPTFYSDDHGGSKRQVTI